MDLVLLLWLQKCRIVNGIALKLSQLGCLTIEAILLLNPDNNKAEFTEYEDGNGTAKILKGQRLHLMR